MYYILLTLLSAVTLLAQIQLILFGIQFLIACPLRYIPDRVTLIACPLRYLWDRVALLAFPLCYLREALLCSYADYVTFGSVVTLLARHYVTFGSAVTLLACTLSHCHRQLKLFFLLTNLRERRRNVD